MMVKVNTIPLNTAFQPPRVNTEVVKIINVNIITNNDPVHLHLTLFFLDIYVNSCHVVQIIHIEINNRIELHN